MNAHGVLVAASRRLISSPNGDIDTTVVQAEGGVAEGRLGFIETRDKQPFVDDYRTFWLKPLDELRLLLSDLSLENSFS